jgi:hypothetical protein
MLSGIRGAVLSGTMLISPAAIRPSACGGAWTWARAEARLAGGPTWPDRPAPAIPGPWSGPAPARPGAHSRPRRSRGAFRAILDSRAAPVTTVFSPLRPGFIGAIPAFGALVWERPANTL